MAKAILGENKTGYLNWDIAEHREYILKQQLPNTNTWVFDELHKYSNWRDYLKGVYDHLGGESLQGRYHYLRLHPFSIAELGINNKNDLLELLQLGGFPEPFFSSSEIEANR